MTATPKVINCDPYLVSDDFNEPEVRVPVSVSVDSVIAVIIAEYVRCILISALVPDSADIEALVGCGTCYAVFGDDVVIACVFMNDGMAVEVESNGFPVYIESAVLELLACIIVEKTLTEFEQQMEVFIASQLGLAR